MPINSMLLDDHLLSLILSQLPIKDKFKMRVICHRFNRILIRLISRITTLNLKQAHLCEWTNSIFNELNTLNLTNIDQIKRLLAKFNRIERLKLKLICSHLLDYRQLNTLSTVNLKELYLLVNCDTIYRQIIYLQIQNVESLIIYCNKYDYLNVLPKQISFLNHFKRLQYFSSNLKHCCAQMDGEFDFQSPIRQTSSNAIYCHQRPQSKYSVQTLPILMRNHTIANLQFGHLIIDSVEHLDLVKSFTRLQKLSILSIKEDYLDKFVFNLPYITHLIVRHLSTLFIEIDQLFQCLQRFRHLRYLNLSIHRLNLDDKMRKLLTDFLAKSRAKLVLNNFEINDLNDLNQFQRFLSILPSRIKQSANLKHLTGDELNLNYCSNIALNKFVYNRIRCLSIRKFIRASHLKSITNHLINLHYIEICDYFDNVDELIHSLLAGGSSVYQIKTIKLIRVNIVNMSTLLHLTKFRNLIHLEIHLKYFTNGSVNHRNIAQFTNGNKLNKTGDDSMTNNSENRVIAHLYSFAHFQFIQKLILRKFKLTTNLLLFLIESCPNLYLINVNNCTNVDHLILQTALLNKFASTSVLNR